MINDVRLALRVLLRSPGFAFVAVATLALAIGANTAIFSLIDGIFLHGLPFERPSELVRIHGEARDRNMSGLNTSITKFEHLRDHQKSFSVIAADFVNGVTLTGLGDPQQIAADHVTSNYFDVIGVKPAMGRLFRPDEESDGDHVAILSAEFWARQFNRDPQILGRSLTLNGVPHTIVGILPPQPVVFFGEIDVWTTRPLEYPGVPAEIRARGFSFLRVIGRLAPGVTLAQANESLGGLTESYRAANAEKGDSTWTLTAANLEGWVIGRDLRTTLWILLGAVGLVLLIAISNVANLLLVHFSARRREIALRLALGGDRRRIVRLFLTESLLVSLVAAVIGVGIARLSLKVLLSVNPPLPVGREIELSFWVLGFAIVLAVLTGVIMGLYPSAQAARTDVVAALNEGGRGSRVTQGQQRFRMMLVGGQVALSFVLLAGALLLLTSVVKLQRQDTGFTPASVLVGRINLPTARYPDKARQAIFTDALIETLRHRPGIKNAAMAIGVPLTGGNILGPYSRTGDKFVEFAKRPLSLMRSISSGYFDSLGIPILAGREFTVSDLGTSPRVVILSKSSADRLFPEGDALGNHLIVGAANGGQEAEIVGIVGNVRSQSLWGQPDIEIYRPLTQRPGDAGSQQLIVKTDAVDPLEALPIVRSAIKAADPNLALVGPNSLTALVSQSISQERFLTGLLGTFAGVAVALAVVGIYGVIAFLTTQRRGEIGIRLALGAAPGDVVRLVLRQGLRPVVLGLIAGFCLMLWLGRLLEAQLFGTTRFDPVSFAVTALGLLIAAFLACSLPAWRASRVGPAVALRD
jgi:putative ABC transport system permease protein